MRFFALSALALILTACGLDEAGQLASDSGQDVSFDAPITTDASNDGTLADAPLDSTIDADDASDGSFVDASDGGPNDAAPDANDGGGCPLNACTVANVPSGWEPTAYKENTNGCPATFNGTAYVTNPTSANGTCTCGCAVAQNPVCDVGQITTGYSSGNTCSQTGQPISFTGAGCNGGVNGNLENYYRSSTIALSGGKCTSTPMKGAAGSTSAESCAPTICKEAICAGTVPAGYGSCIETAGDQTCPGSSPFTTKHVVGTTVDVQCTNACTCGVTGQCTSPKVAFYSDNACANLLAALDSNNTCVATGTNATASSAKYSATLTNAACTKGGTTTPQLDLTGKRTICCRP
ncbi:hypothetical protein BH09MYX1_BH09MYX1_24340 [soil metagenome]